MFGLPSSVQTFLLASGLALATLTFSRRPITALAIASVGGYWLYRQVTGHCPISDAIQHFAEQSSHHEIGEANPSSYSRSGDDKQGTARALPLHEPTTQELKENAKQSALAVGGKQAKLAPMSREAPRRDSERIDEVVAESFPASDPPCYSAGT